VILDMAKGNLGKGRLRPAMAACSTARRRRKNSHKILIDQHYASVKAEFIHQEW